MEKCDFCGTEKVKTNVLIAGQKGFICDKCINQAHGLLELSPEEVELRDKAKELVKEMQLYENKIDKECPINKTARIVAYNREITLNIFENLYEIDTKKHLCSGSKEYSESIKSNHQLSEETFCLLVKLLNESVEKFGIDYESVVKQLANGKKITLTFEDLKEEE